MAIAAVGQICSTGSITANLNQCVRLVAKAAVGGAKVLFLPEASDYIALNAQASLDLAVPQASSPFVQGLRAAAKAHSIAVHVGIHDVPPSASGDSKARKILNRALAFTLRTGEAHWEALLRARAIETQSYVVAAAQVGRHNEKRASYGRSMVVDPWGKVLLCLGGVADAEGNAEDGAVEAIGFVDIDLGELERVRREMPLQRRT
ncbi:carbon-nitrogen hydrolase [Trichoderma longibrachiatum ATCC 18648]|uniref:Carbon-nitrogen hydrolase n=1 Tax=Trichoderma longibrachiatum ATCC 18648 TaxID=983965 RepID=A0A2T4CGR8_TRILO|nr:carbon-nitrogen hydrolase [Trichoderma longibrachiatum ATCC 18648]